MNSPFSPFYKKRNVISKIVTTNRTVCLKGLEEKLSYALKITILPVDQDGTIRGLDTL